MKKEEKQLAKWIYYEDGSLFYCSDCIEKRLDEVNSNKEFSEDINYDVGDTCGYYSDYADVDYELECCKCSVPLYSKID